MRVYLCVMWEDDSCAAKYAICANISEIKKVYKEYLLSIRSEEKWLTENWGYDTMDELVEHWWDNDNYFEIVKLDVRGA